MTSYFTPRRQVAQARQYRAGGLSELRPEALADWITSLCPGWSVPSVTTDDQGFSITIDMDIDGTNTLTGTVGDWIIIPSEYTVRVVTTNDLFRDYENF